MEIDETTLKYFETLKTMNIDTADTINYYNEAQQDYTVYSERQFQFEMFKNKNA